MLLFVFTVAVVNLAVGYALGAELTVGKVLDWLPRRSDSAPDPTPDDGEQLTRPPAKVTLGTPAKQPLVQAAPVPMPASAPAPDPPSPPKPGKPTSKDVLAGLAEMREKLSATSLELTLSEDDSERFGQSATRLQQANHAYLEGADQAIQSLDKLGAEGDKAAAASAKAVADGRKAVADISGEIDDLIEAGLESEQARKALLDKSEQAREAAEKAEADGESALRPGAARAAVAEPDANDGDANGGADNGADNGANDDADQTPTVESVDALFDRLESALESANSDSVRHVAAVRVDPIAGQESDAALQEAAEQAVNELIAGVIEEHQTFTPGRPALLMLDGDDLESASQRVERLRRKVAAAPVAGAEVTVTCALIDARPGDSRDKVVDRLNESLEEATRLGANRTYHHDGGFPTPISDDTADQEAEAASVGG